MQLTSEQCRAQEAIQWQRAKDEPLENVRIIAQRAAIAWGQEAVLADHLEARRLRARLIAEIRQIDRDRTSEGDERAFGNHRGG